MYDSTAKPPSGFLNGNVNQLGDFDLCLAANLKERGIYGQYCLASMQVEAPKSPYLSAIHKLIHSHNAFKSKLQDVSTKIGMRVEGAIYLIRQIGVYLQYALISSIHIV